MFKSLRVEVNIIDEVYGANTTIVSLQTFRQMYQGGRNIHVSLF